MTGRSTKRSTKQAAKDASKASKTQKTQKAEKVGKKQVAEDQKEEIKERTWLNAQHGCVADWDDEGKVPANGLKEMVQKLTPKELDDAGKNIQHFVVKILKTFKLPYGGKAERSVRNFLHKFRQDLGLTVKRGAMDTLTEQPKKSASLLTGEFDARLALLSAGHQD